MTDFTIGPNRYLQSSGDRMAPGQLYVAHVVTSSGPSRKRALRTIATDAVITRAERRRTGTPATAQSARTITTTKTEK